MSQYGSTQYCGGVYGGTPPVSVTGATKGIITTPNKFFDMGEHTFKKGDLADTFTETLKDDNGAIDLSNANQVRLVMQDREGTKALDQVVTVTSAADGEIEYQWESGDPIDTKGIYRYEVIIEDSVGDNTVPNDGHGVIEIEEDLE